MGGIRENGKCPMPNAKTNAEARRLACFGIRHLSFDIGERGQRATASTGADGHGE
jgi:hypothetical protein